MASAPRVITVWSGRPPAASTSKAVSTPCACQSAGSVFGVSGPRFPIAEGPSETRQRYRVTADATKAELDILPTAHQKGAVDAAVGAIDDPILPACGLRPTWIALSGLAR